MKGQYNVIDPSHNPRRHIIFYCRIIRQDVKIKVDDASDIVKGLEEQLEHILFNTEIPTIFELFLEFIQNDDLTMDEFLLTPKTLYLGDFALLLQLFCT